EARQADVRGKEEKANQRVKQLPSGIPASIHSPPASVCIDNTSNQPPAEESKTGRLGSKNRVLGGVCVLKKRQSRTRREVADPRSTVEMEPQRGPLTAASR